MNKKADPIQRYAFLPCGRKVKILSIDRDTALVQRLGGRERGGTLAVCPIDKLKAI
jgi:hypothetical protein